MGKWCDAGSQSIKKCADYTTLYGFPTYVSRFCRHAMYHLSQTFFVIPQLLANPTKYKKIGSSHASMDLSVNPCYHHLRVAQHHGTGLNDLPLKRGTSSFPFDAPVIIAVFLNSKNAVNIEITVVWWFRDWTFGETNLNWLVVSTHLKNISQIGSFPQVGVKIINIWNHQPVK